MLGDLSASGGGGGEPGGGGAGGLPVTAPMIAPAKGSSSNETHKTAAKRPPGRSTRKASANACNS